MTDQRPHTQFVKQSMLLSKRSSFLDVTIQLWTHGSRPPILYEFHKIHNSGVPLRPIIGITGTPTYRLAKHLVSLLGSKLGNSLHNVRKSDNFVQTLDTLQVNLNDIIMLFTRVLIKDALNPLSQQFDEDNINLFNHVLTSSFCFNGHIHKHMGSPRAHHCPLLLPASSWRTKEMALSRVAYKPACWFHYADDMLVVWLYEPEKLNLSFSTSIANIPTSNAPWRLI